MNFKTTIVLLVLLAGMGIYLFATRDQGTKTTETNTATGDRKLLAIDAKDVTKLIIEPADGPKETFEKSGIDWTITEPVKARAESFEVDSLVRSLCDLKSRQRVDAKDTGVDAPRFKVELLTGDGKSAKLWVGQKMLIGNQMYVKLDGESQADVVPADISDSLEKPLKDYRDAKLVQAGYGQIKQIRITRPEGMIALEKSGNDWKVTAPTSMPVDASAATDLTGAIEGLRATDYVSETGDDLKQYQLAEPKLTVWYSTETPSTQPTTGPATQAAGTTITFGRFDDILKKNVFAKVSDAPTVVKISADAIKAFKKEAYELRDKKIVDVDPEKVNALTLKVDARATTQPTTRAAINTMVSIVRNIEPVQLGPVMPATTMSSTAPSAATKPAVKWKLAGGAKGTVDEAKVVALLDALHPLMVEQYVSGIPATQPAAATYTLVISTDKGTTELTLDDEGMVYGLCGGAAFEVNKSMLEKVQGDFINNSAAK